MFKNTQNNIYLSLFDEIKRIFNKNKPNSKSKYESKLLSGNYNDLHDINIAYVLKGFPTLSQTFVLNELRYLVENNYNVVVFCYEDPTNLVGLDFDIEVIRFDAKDFDINNLSNINSKEYKSKNPNPEYIKDNEILLSNLEELLISYKIDLIHTHFVYPPATFYTYPICEKLQIPFTVFAHAADIFKYAVDKINKVGEISQSKYCKAIFTLSNYHKNYLMERNVPEEKIILTRQATEYKISELKMRSENVRKIVAISRFVEKKGIDVLIDAADILKDEDFEFSIYGFGALENKYKKQINSLGLENISVKGLLNGPEEVKKVFEKSDLLVAPCKIAKSGDRDGIPTVLFEAMAYGVNVLTTSVSAIPEVINNNENGFIIEPDDAEALASKIKEISQLSSEERFNIAKKAQEDVQNISSVEKTVNTLLETWMNK